MEIFQHILVYITVFIAVGYLVKKFLLPRSLFAGKKGSAKAACGKEGGCH